MSGQIPQPSQPAQQLSLQTLIAYCRTSYRVHAPSGTFVLRVGQRHPEFDAELLAARAERWAFLTAWNPRSVVLDPEENAARHARLLARVGALDLVVWPGAGAGDDPGWVPEESLLITGIDADRALELAREFEQHAIVVGSRGEPAELRFPFEKEAEEALRAASMSEDPILVWTARRAVLPRH